MNFIFVLYMIQIKSENNSFGIRRKQRLNEGQRDNKREGQQ